MSLIYDYMRLWLYIQQNDHTLALSILVMTKSFCLRAISQAHSSMSPCLIYCIKFERLQPAKNAQEMNKGPERWYRD